MSYTNLSGAKRGYYSYDRLNARDRRESSRHAYLLRANRYSDLHDRLKIIGGPFSAGDQRCMSRLKNAGTAPVPTQLAKSENGARERQPQNLRGVNTGDGTPSSPSQEKYGFPVHIEAFPNMGYFINRPRQEFCEW